MTTDCGHHVIPFEAQLPQRYGGTICSAVGASRVANKATCGKVNTTGAHIRSLTNEPVPDKKSPGLSLPQVCNVLEDHYGIPMDIFIGPRALTFEQYEAKRSAGRPGIIQVGYGPIAMSRFDGGHGFRGGHAIAEDNNATYDPLADGRRRGAWQAWDFDGRLYSRTLIQQAAASLDLGNGHHPAGVVWAAFAPDVVPEYHISIHPAAHRKYRVFQTFGVVGGVVQSVHLERTRGFQARGRIRCFPWPGHGVIYLLRITTGAWAGRYIRAGWGEAL